MYAQLTYSNVTVTDTTTNGDGTTPQLIAVGGGKRQAVEITNNTSATIMLAQISGTGTPTMSATLGYPLAAGSSKIYGSDSSVRHWMISTVVGTVRTEVYA